MGRARPASAALLIALALLASIAATFAYAAFGSQTQNEGNAVTAVPDFRAPAIGSGVIGKTQGGITGASNRAAPTTSTPTSPPTPATRRAALPP